MNYRPGHPDAELLRLWAEYDRLWHHIKSCEGLSDEESNTLSDQITEVEFAIQDTPARTLEGLAVKAKLAVEYAPPRDPDGSPSLQDILINLAEEVQRLAQSRPGRDQRSGSPSGPSPYENLRRARGRGRIVHPR